MAESGVNFHVAGQMPQHSELLEGIQSLCLKQHKNEHVNIASHFRKQKINQTAQTKLGEEEKCKVLYDAQQTPLRPNGQDHQYGFFL